MKHKVYKVVTAVTAIAVAAAALYIMIRGIGLSDSLDSGAGAYYYADIPDFEKYEPSFFTKVPLWAHILLFLLWGFLMYRLWIRIDRGRKDKNK